MDAETRAVLAFYLSIHAPSTVSCMMAIRAMVEEALYAVISDHKLPDAASLTAATRGVYSNALLIEDPTAAEQEASLDMPTFVPAAFDPPDDDSVLRIPLPKPTKGRLKMNYDSLPTSRPV
jgi:putative transposase